MTRRLLTTTGSFGFLLLLFLPAVAGQPEPSQVCPLPALPDAPQRKLTYESGAGSFSFDNARDAGPGSDLLRGRFDLAAAEFHLEYISTQPGNESILRFDQQYVAVVEYRDQHADGRYGAGDDTVRRIGLPSAPGASLRVLPRPDGGFQALASYPLNASRDDGGLPLGSATALPGRLDLRFTVVPTSQSFADDGFHPDRVSLQLQILGYPYRENGTALALEVRTESNRGVESLPQRFEAAGDRHALRHWFASCSSADDRVAPTRVLVEALPGAPTGATAFFAFARADALIHESAFDVQRLPAPSAPPGLPEFLPPGNLALYVGGAVATAALVVVPAWRRLRPQG